MLEDRDSYLYYRWLNLKNFRKSLKRNKLGVSHEFPNDLSQALLQTREIKECPVWGAAYNVLKFYLKNGTFCHLKSKCTLGYLIENSHPVFVKDDKMNLGRIVSMRIIEKETAFYYDSRMYQLQQINGELMVKRYYP